MGTEAQSSPKDILRKPYHRVVVPDEDGSFSAEISEFPGCIAVGETGVDALSMLEEVAESWLEVALANNQEIPQPAEELEYSGKTVLRFAKSLHRQAANAAKREGVSLNQFIVTALAMHVGMIEAVRPATIGLPTYNFFNVMTQPNQSIMLVSALGQGGPYATSTTWKQLNQEASPWKELVNG